MFEHLYELRYSDLETEDRIRPAALLDIVQDIAILHTTAKGYDICRLKEMERAWLMQSIKLHLEAKADPHLPLLARTAIIKNGGATSLRGCILQQNGITVAKTLANWFFFDLSTQQPCRIPKEMLAAFPCCDLDDDFFRPAKTTLLEAQKLCTVKLGRKEMDTNRHLNNQKSAELLMDALPEQMQLRDMSIVYKQPAYIGDELDICRRQTDTGWYVHLQKDGQICVAGIFE